MTLRAVPKPAPRQPRGKKPVPRTNLERKAKRYAAAYGAKGAWIRGQSCCLTGRFTGQWVYEVGLGQVQVVVVAAHFPSRGAGGKAAQLVPLADHLHRYAHQHSDKALEQRFGVDLKALAKDYEARWQTLQARSGA